MQREMEFLGTTILYCCSHIQEVWPGVEGSFNGLFAELVVECLYVIKDQVHITLEINQEKLLR